MNEGGPTMPSNEKPTSSWPAEAGPEPDWFSNEDLTTDQMTPRQLAEHQAYMQYLLRGQDPHILKFAIEDAAKLDDPGAT
jgi:hypothetical protein